jgi:prophage regulatory protein
MEQILRIADVCKMLGIARSTIYLWQKTANFPYPRKLGDRAVGWRQADIDRWLESRP